MLKSLIISSAVLLTACGGGNAQTGFVCTAGDNQGATVWYHCDYSDYAANTDKTPAPVGYYVRSFYDDTNKNHIAEGRAYIEQVNVLAIDSDVIIGSRAMVFAVGSNASLGNISGNSLLVKTADNFYVSE